MRGNLEHHHRAKCDCERQSKQLRKLVQMGGFHGLQYNALTSLAIRGTFIFACSQFCSSSLILLTVVIIKGICGGRTAQSSCKICHAVFFSGQNPKLPEFGLHCQLAAEHQEQD